MEKQMDWEQQRETKWKNKNSLSNPIIAKIETAITKLKVNTPPLPIYFKARIPLLVKELKSIKTQPAESNIAEYNCTM